MVNFTFLCTNNNNKKIEENKQMSAELYETICSSFIISKYRQSARRRQLAEFSQKIKNSYIKKYIEVDNENKTAD